MERICGECRHYNQGNAEYPCAKGNKRAGYLREGMKCWGMKEDEEPTKVCPICGKTLPISKFYLTTLTDDSRSEACKECCGPYRKIKKRKS